MIKGPQRALPKIVDKPMVNYRALDALNYSMIKKFDEKPVEFFEQFKLGKRGKEKESVELQIGDLVDFYLLECKGDIEVFLQRFDEKYVLFEGSKGTKQSFLLADHLFDVTKESLSDSGEVTVSFEERFKEAFIRTQAQDKYKGKTWEDALLEFEVVKKGEEYSPKDYFEKKLDNIDKMIRDISIVEKSKTVAQILMNDDFTRDVFMPNPELEVLEKFVIEWELVVKGGRIIKCKSEIDILFIDHENKIIYIKDLKTTYDNEGFEYSYIKNYYYIQAAFYYLAVQWFAKNHGGLEDYEIVPMEFIVGDTSSNNRRPVRYQTTMEDIEAGLNGFSMNHNWYRGVYELIDEIMWCEENEMWNISRKTFEANGKLKLNIKYD